jgi:hypothetical protein
MLVDIVGVTVLDGHKLRIRFQDGVEGDVDLDALVRWEGVLEPLRDAARFAELRVNPELGTICWPNGADLDPDVLYSVVTGRPIELREPLLRR